jgi:hypothetical protein
VRGHLEEIDTLLRPGGAGVEATPADDQLEL